MEICINDKTSKNRRCEKLSEFNQQPWEIYQIYLIHDTIQKLDFVVAYFNVKITNIALQELT